MMPAYFDHNATTPVHPAVFDAMAPYYQEKYGNASCVYSLGVEASYAIEKARMQLAALVNAEPHEIIWTSGGTESDNLAIKGAYFALKKPRIIISAIEHPAVTAACDFLRTHLNATVSTVPVDRNGRVNPADIEQAITPETALVTVMMANNEIGSIQPIQQIASLCRARGVLCHTDAVQAVGKIPVDVKALGVDLLSISGHKIYGPKGVGALYVRDGVSLVNQSHGGSHEQGLRGGTENVPGIVGLGKAAELAKTELESRAAHDTALRDLLWEKLQASGLELLRNSPADAVLPGTLNLSLPGVNARELVYKMDEQGFCIATGSACSTGKATPSTVVQAIGRTEDEALASIRISLGRENTTQDIEHFVTALIEAVKQQPVTR